MTERTSQGFRSETKPLAIGGAVATTVLAGAAEATTLDEGTFGVGDFGNTFGTKTLLPVGTDVVNDLLDQEIGSDFDAFVTFQSLPVAAAFELEATSSHNAFNIFSLDQYGDGGTSVQSGTGPGVTLTGTIPASGQLHFLMNLEGVRAQLPAHVLGDPRALDSGAARRRADRGRGLAAVRAAAATAERRAQRAS